MSRLETGLNWIPGEPKTPGYYLLEFSGGDRFVVVNAYFDVEEMFRMEDADKGGFVMEQFTTGGWVKDTTDIITQHLLIPKPGEPVSTTIFYSIASNPSQVDKETGKGSDYNTGPSYLAREQTPTEESETKRYAMAAFKKAHVKPQQARVDFFGSPTAMARVIFGGKVVVIRADEVDSYLEE